MKARAAKAQKEEAEESPVEGEEVERLTNVYDCFGVAEVDDMYVPDDPIPATKITVQ